VFNGEDYFGNRSSHTPVLMCNNTQSRYDSRRWATLVITTSAVRFINDVDYAIYANTDGRQRFLNTGQTLRSQGGRGSFAQHVDTIARCA